MEISNREVFEEIFGNSIVQSSIKSIVIFIGGGQETTTGSTVFSQQSTQ